jgi:hypothetical protein
MAKRRRRRKRRGKISDSTPAVPGTDTTGVDDTDAPSEASVSESSSGDDSGDDS